MLNKSNKRSKAVYALVYVALGLLFYVYLTTLQKISQKRKDLQTQMSEISYKKPLTDAERVAECSMSEACSLLAQVSYYESRDQKTDAAIAGPMFVVLNRRDHSKNWGSSLHSVVYEYKQFSYTHDGSLARGIQEQKSYKRMLKIAHYVWSGEVEDPTGGAYWYHSVKVSPAWSQKLQKTTKLGSHIYYKEI